MNWEELRWVKRNWEEFRVIVRKWGEFRGIGSVGNFFAKRNSDSQIKVHHISVTYYS